MLPVDHNSGSNMVASKPVEAAEKISYATGRSLEQEMEAWKRNSTWTDEKPALEVRHFHWMDLLVIEEYYFCYMQFQQNQSTKQPI